MRLAMPRVKYQARFSANADEALDRAKESILQAGADRLERRMVNVAIAGRLFEKTQDGVYVRFCGWPAAKRRIDNPPADLDNCPVAQIIRSFKNGPCRIHQRLVRYDGIHLIENHGKRPRLKFENITISGREFVQIR
jgi:hypothetical protein